jgi:hypothetical protein
MLVYCMAMGNPKKASTRVTRDDWLQGALKLLADDGISPNNDQKGDKR